MTAFTLSSFFVQCFRMAFSSSASHGTATMLHFGTGSPEYAALRRFHNLVDYTVRTLLH